MQSLNIFVIFNIPNFIIFFYNFQHFMFTSLLERKLAPYNESLKFFSKL